MWPYSPSHRARAAAHGTPDPKGFKTPRRGPSTAGPLTSMRTGCPSIAACRRASAAAERTTIMIDATHLKAHRSVSRLRSKEGGSARHRRSIGRAKGGLNTKLHAVTITRGRPLGVFITAGQVGDDMVATDTGESELRLLIRGFLAPVLLIVAVLGSTLGGMARPTEAAGGGADPRGLEARAVSALADRRGVHGGAGSVGAAGGGRPAGGAVGAAAGGPGGGGRGHGAGGGDGWRRPGPAAAQAI